MYDLITMAAFSDELQKIAGGEALLRTAEPAALGLFGKGRLAEPLMQYVGRSGEFLSSKAVPASRKGSIRRLAKGFYEKHKRSAPQGMFP